MVDAVEEIERYPDGTEVKRFPRYVYPGGKPATNPANRYEHNGVLVNNQKELDAALKSFGPSKPVEEKPAKKQTGNW